MRSTGFGLGEVVQTRYEFSCFVQLNRAFEPDYRRACRAAFLPTDVENRIFKAVARAAQGNLDQGRRNLLILSPFGTGKSLDLVMVYDIFSSKGNTDAVKGFEEAVRNELLGLTSQGPYLVVPVVGTESPKPLSQAILGAFRRAVETHPFLKDVEKASPFLIQVEYEQAALWLRQIGDGGLGHLRSPVEAFLRSHPAGHTLTSLERALEANDPTALEIWRSTLQAVTGHPPSAFGVATPRDIFDRALPELQARGIVGIALLVDELSQYLRLNPQYEAEAIRTLDPLVHWIHEHEPCFSIVATQARPERLQEGVTDADYQAWASLQGRFQVLPMDRQRYDALIAKALTRAPNPPTDPDKHPQMQDLLEVHAACFSGDDRAKAQRAVAGYYPFHPTVIAAIGAIADSLGQFERSIFQYLDRRTEGGFKNLIDAEPVYLGSAGERLRLVTLDEVFRFFAQDWSKLEGVNDSFAQASRQAEAVAADSPLGRRVLDLITLLAFIEGRAALPTPTLDGIATMLNVSGSQELEALLGRFVGEGYFTWDETFGYRLATAGGPRPSEVKNAIQRKISESVQLVTGATVLQHLNNYQNLRSRLKSRPAPVFPIERSYGVTVKNVTKRFQREFMTARQLVDRASSLRPGDTLAGNLLLGVVTSADNANGKQYGQSVTAAKTLAQAGAIVALPRQPVDAFTKAVKNYEAAKNVSEDSRLGGSDVAKQALEAVQYELLITLSGQYETERLDWFTPANPAVPVRFNDGDAPVQAAAQKLMEKFPDGIARRDLVGGNTLETVIRPLLDGGGPIELRGKASDVFVSALQPLGVVSVGPKTKDPKRTVMLTEPDSNVPELVASAEIWNRLAKALPVGAVVDSEALYDALRVLQRPPYWCPEDLVAYLLAAYMGKYRAEVKQPYDSFHKPSVEEAKTLVRRRSSGAVTIPQSTALSTDQTLFVESVARAVAATLPPAAVAYAPRSLDPKAPEPGLAGAGEDLGRWHRDYGAYASELFSRHGLGPREAGDFLKAMAEAAAGGPDRLKAVRLYTYTLPAALRVPSNQAPLVAEQMIEGLTELGAAREEIDRAATVAVTDSAVAAAWAKFAPDSLNKEQRQRLLQALRGAKEKVRPSTPGAPAAPDKTEPAVDGRTGRVAETRVGVDELRTFAEFVLVVAAEVKSGARVVGSLEELVGAYRATPPKGVAGA